MPTALPAHPAPWHSHLTADLLHRVLHQSLLHPIAALFLPLLFLALSYRPHHPPVQLAFLYALAVNAYHLLRAANTRLAFGRARKWLAEDELVVITGGAQGLGRVLADMFSMRGVRVAVLDVQIPDAAEREAALARGLRFWKCDVGVEEEVRRVCEEVEREMGGVTVLVNNAGVVRGKTLLECSAEEVKRSFDTNVLAHYHMIRALLPGMVRRRCGTVVTVSSTLRMLPAARTSCYAPAKAAVAALHHALTAEMEGCEGIRTVLVTPGQMRTLMFDFVKTPSAFFAPVVEPVEVAREVVRLVAEGRSGEVNIPLYAAWLPLLPCLPWSLQRALRWASGADRAMEEAARLMRKGE